MSSIFLSHNHLDKPFARRLAKNLKKLGVRVWIDEAEVKIGDSLIEKIREGIDQMEYLGVVLSSHSIDSAWVKKEVDIAMNQEIEGRRLKVLPLLIEDCELPGFLKGKLYADFRHKESYKNEFRKLAERLGVGNSLGLPPAKDFYIPITNQIVESVEDSGCILELGGNIKKEVYKEQLKYSLSDTDSFIDILYHHLQNDISFQIDNSTIRYKFKGNLNGAASLNYFIKKLIELHNKNIIALESLNPLKFTINENMKEPIVELYKQINNLDE